MEHHRVAIGGKIYFLRVAKGMTQEQLAAILCVSPAAVSKWERNLANPGIEILWELADYFECSIDELVGREEKRLEKIGMYNSEKLCLVEVAEELLKCSEISRQEGLLALDDYMKKYKGESGFLSFAVHYFLQSFLKQMDNELIFRLLKNYVTTLAAEEQREGYMIVHVLGEIASGAHPELLREIIASYVGVGYWEKLEDARRGAQGKRTRDEIIGKYKDKKLFSEKTDLLERFASVGDFELQVILRNLDNETLTSALSGASGKIVERFLLNLSDRLLYFVSEDIDRWNGTEEEILKAQRRVLAVGGCFLTE
ncbi:MAG: helix-turn-helix domain-containing protein [Lachnospiraceae bacterium]|nr:helix-turn-helix domain-containing protein [Lachnospiraceae bacterium]MBQ8549352.1 helix-turn-helix domain-containing protein [Lachnospiraceae bacterium]MBQ8846721.1 helix-turn-helix domain-containing protein [Lachnospiraceae bacterium]